MLLLTIKISMTIIVLHIGYPVDTKIIKFGCFLRKIINISIKKIELLIFLC